MIGDGGHAKVIRSFHRGDRIIAVGDNRLRKQIALRNEAGWFPGKDVASGYDKAFHPSAIWHDCDIGEGTVVMAGAVIQPGCSIR